MFGKNWMLASLLVALLAATAWTQGGQRAPSKNNASAPPAEINIPLASEVPQQPAVPRPNTIRKNTVRKPVADEAAPLADGPPAEVVIPPPPEVVVPEGEFAGPRAAPVPAGPRDETLGLRAQEFGFEMGDRGSDFGLDIADRAIHFGLGWLHGDRSPARARAFAEDVKGRAEAFGHEMKARGESFGAEAKARSGELDPEAELRHAEEYKRRGIEYGRYMRDKGANFGRRVQGETRGRDF